LDLNGKIEENGFLEKAC
jgi:hypothetical protein